MEREQTNSSEQRPETSAKKMWTNNWWTERQKETCRYSILLFIRFFIESKINKAQTRGRRCCCCWYRTYIGKNKNSKSTDSDTTHFTGKDHLIFFANCSVLLISRLERTNGSWRQRTTKKIISPKALFKYITETDDEMSTGTRQWAHHYINNNNNIISPEPKWSNREIHSRNFPLLSTGFYGWHRHVEWINKQITVADFQHKKSDDFEWWKSV